MPSNLTAPAFKKLGRHVFPSLITILNFTGHEQQVVPWRGRTHCLEAVSGFGLREMSVNGHQEYSGRIRMALRKSCSAPVEFQIQKRHLTETQQRL